MKVVQTYNVYCDESCHLEHDHIPVMAWGAVSCEAREVKAIADGIRAIKDQHGLTPHFEAKWSKISPAKVEFYLALTELFLIDDRLQFRGLVVPDKSALDHRRFSQTHDEWYYKMYFTMLRYIFNAPHRYNIYLDVKDTRGGPKTRKLHDVLASSLHDINHQCIVKIQQVRSHECELMQIVDLLIGALTYENRGLSENAAKRAITECLKERLGEQALTHTSLFCAAKFNILVWNPQGATE